MGIFSANIFSLAFYNLCFYAPSRSVKRFSIILYVANGNRRSLPRAKRVSKAVTSRRSFSKKPRIPPGGRDERNFDYGTFL